VPKINDGRGLEQLPSGRWRAQANPPGEPRAKSPAFDYAWQAEMWKLVIEHPEAEDPFGYREIQSKAQRARGAELQGWTIDSWAADWLARKTAAKRSETAGWYRRNMLLGADALIPDQRGGQQRMGETPLAGKEKADIEDWVAAMIEAGDGPSAIKARLRVLRWAYTDAMANPKRSGVDLNPAVGVAAPDGPIREKRILSLEEQERLLEIAEPDPLLHAIIRIGLDAGLRWAEIAGLGADCFEPGKIIVRQQVNRRRELDPTTKNHKRRAVPLSAALAAELGPWIQQARRLGPRALLFLADDGRPLDYFAVKNQRWNPALVAAGLRRQSGVEPMPWDLAEPTLHSLRHTWISWLLDEGVQPSRVQAWSGHSDFEVTQGYEHEISGGRADALFEAAQSRRAARLSGSNVRSLSGLRSS
jgi:integrase